MSKRIKIASDSLGDSSRVYTLTKAIDLLLALPAVKFDETIELSAHLGVDPRQSDQMIRGTVSLPNGSGKKVVVLAFTNNPQEALEAGADFAGLDDMLRRVQDGWLGFDVAIATSNTMKNVRSVSRILGPRGLMPNLKSGTIVDDVASGIKAVKEGRVEFKMDKTANLHIVAGKRSFDPEKIHENVTSIINAINQARPIAYKGRYLKSLSISATMSPGIKIDLKEYTKS